jgi:hypothetical protein
MPEGDLHVLSSLLGELGLALTRYWSTAAEVLRGGGVQLREPGPDAFSLERNFFSVLFLFSYHRLGIPAPRRILYATVNQCLRGMVTGCDNLLDDEYKPTLETDLPPRAIRFRSVLDIMVSDRVLCQVLAEQVRDGVLSTDQIVAASNASLRALLRSGVQEASEEGGLGGRLAPQAVLDAVHRYKTGLLFQAPWVVPRVLEAIDEDRVGAVEEALYWLGMGCQVLDDLVDLGPDLRQGRHNYVASLAYHAPDADERERLEAWRLRGPEEEAANLALAVPRARKAAGRTALELLHRGASGLFDGASGLIDASIAFLVRRIGAQDLVGSDVRGP